MFLYCLYIAVYSIPLLSQSSASYQHASPHRSAAVEEGEGGDKEVAKEEVKSSGTAPERVLYHVIMMLVSR